MNLDDFDEQIRIALRLEPSRQQLARLECFWRQQSRAERRRRRIRRVATLAATVLVAVGLSAWLWRQEPTRQPLEANRRTQVTPTAPDPNHADAREDTMGVQPLRNERSLSAGRPPTAYERLFFAAHTRRSVAGRAPSVAATIDEVIEQLTRDPDADAGQLAESFGLMERDAEWLLLRQLRRSSDEKKHAVLRLLAVCGTPRSTPYLLRLGRREAFRDKALATIERIVSVEQLADVVSQTSDRRVRAAVLGRLLSANSESALRGYLTLIHDDALRAEALAAADTIAKPVLATLLALLDDEEEDEDVRIAAAMVLGHVNGPEVTNSLIALVTREPSSPTEAWIALLACRGEQTEEFFAYASRHPRLLGQVNRARVWWARMIP